MEQQQQRNRNKIGVVKTLLQSSAKIISLILASIYHAYFSGGHTIHILCMSSTEYQRILYVFILLPTAKLLFVENTILLKSLSNLALIRRL